MEPRLGKEDHCTAESGKLPVGESYSCIVFRRLGCASIITWGIVAVTTCFDVFKDFFRCFDVFVLTTTPVDSCTRTDPGAGPRVDFGDFNFKPTKGQGLCKPVSSLQRTTEYT